MKERRFVLYVKKRPRALPSARAKAGQKGYRPRSYQKWAADVKEELRRIWKSANRGVTLTGPVSVEIALCRSGFTVWIAPSGESERAGLTGDADNYAKAILDCLTKAGVIGDDQQVESVQARFYQPEGERAALGEGT